MVRICLVSKQEQMLKFKVVLFAVLMFSIATLMGWIFWKQELQYALPTPKPVNFVDVRIGDTVNLKKELNLRTGDMALLHFFNADCPCSRFNMKDFESLAHRFKKEVNFFVVIQSKEINAEDKFKRKYG